MELIYKSIALYIFIIKVWFMKHLSLCPVPSIPFFKPPFQIHGGVAPVICLSLGMETFPVTCKLPTSLTYSYSLITIQAGGKLLPVLFSAKNYTSKVEENHICSTVGTA